MRRKLLGENNLAVAASLQTVGAILRRYGGQSQADVTEADTVLREALALRRKLPDVRPTDLADTLTSLGLLLAQEGKTDEAIACHREALDLRRQALGDDDPTVGNSLTHLGEALGDAGKFPEAEAVQRQALALETKFLDPDNRRLNLTRDALGQTLLTEGKLPEAEAQFRASTEHWMKRPNWETDKNATRAIFFLGRTLEQEGKLADAEALDQQTLASLKQALPINNESMMDTLYNLERVLRLEHKPDEARSLVEAYLDEARLKLAPDDPGMISISGRAAWHYYMAGRLVEAQPLADELLKAVRAQPSSNSREIPDPIDTVAWIDEATGRLDQAVPLFEETVAARKAAGGSPSDPNTLGEMQALGQAYQEAGRLTDSQRLLEETLNLYKTKDISQNLDAASALATLGLTLIRENKFAEAESRLRESLAISGKQSDLLLPSYTQSVLGEALAGEKKYADAEQLLLQGYRGMKEKENLIYGNRARILMDAAQRLVALYTAWEKPDSAAQWSATVDSIRKAAPTTAPSN
jgi:eukaryotic-like serine/threonine-protein kinase